MDLTSGHAITTSLDDPGRWQAAIAETDGRQLVVAGPGTGKTEFLARRAAHLLGSGTPGSRLLVLTFSRRAAAALDDRIAGHLPGPVGDAAATTFHSFAHRLVESHRFSRGSPAPVLLTGPEQVRFVADLLTSEDPSGWPLTFRPLLASATLAAEVADFLMRCHERLLEVEDLRQLAEGRADWRALPEFLRRYREQLETAGKIDYGLLIAEAAGILASSGPRYDYVIVDEYQDTSPAQAELAELAAREGNLTVAADPHQSIYSFRGAEPENVAAFSQQVERTGGRMIVLGRSLRVPSAVLDSARRLVAPNRSPWPATVPAPAAHEGSVEVYTFDQRSAEAEWIASEVERLHHAEDLALSSMAVLVRSTRHLLPELSRALDRRGIAHDRPDTRLVDHPAVRIFADAVQAATAPPTGSERELAIRRLLLGPAVGLSLARERELARRRRSATWEELIRRELAEAAGLAELIEDDAWATRLRAVEGFWHAWERLPRIEELVADPGRADYRRAWHGFSRMLERQSERDPDMTLWESVAATAGGDFEASPALSLSRSPGDRLVVTTLHQAKGLEFEIVFVADAIEGVFPDERRTSSLLQPQLLSGPAATDGGERARRRLEEERRLAYTATTRARRRVVWTATAAGIDEGQRRPSRFMPAAAGLDSFEAIGTPETTDSNLFDPLTLPAAEAQLRRLLLDPGAPEPGRLAALAALAAGSHWDPLTFAGVPEPGPDEGLIEPPVRLSPSQAGVYDRCPRRYALERRLRALDSQSPYALFGSIVHEVLEETEKTAVAAGLAHGDVATALARLDTVWREHPPFGPPPLDEAWRRRAEKLLTDLYADWPGGDGIPVALEMELHLEIGGVEWVGRADRIERVAGGLKVIDYKTSKNPPPATETARSLQLGYYLLAAAASPELAEHGPLVGAELWYPLAEGRRVFPFDLSNLAEVAAALEAVSEGVTRERWEPRVGSHCGRCPFREVCPAWPDGREGHR